MSRYEEYLLIHAFYTLCILFITFITALASLGILKVYYPNLYNKILVRIRKWNRISRWERKGNFRKVAQSYRRQSNKRKRYKLLFLGIADLYEYKWEQAIPHFENYIDISVGKRDQLRAKNYLAIASLQGGNYSNALRLFEECRKSGNVHIIPYVLTLVMLDKGATARDFYDAFPAPDWAHPLMEALLAFNKRSLNSLTPIEHIANNLQPRFHLYRPIIEAIVERFKMELFFQTEGCNEMLRDELNLIASEISQQPGLFESPRLQWFRKFIIESAGRIPNRVIWFGELEEVFIQAADIEPFKPVLAKLHWLYELHRHDVSVQDFLDFFHSILPQSAEKLISYEHFIKYELFKDERLQLGFQLYTQYDRWDQCYVSMRVLPISEVVEVHKIAEPLLSSEATVPADIRPSYHRVLHDIFITRKSLSYWKKQVLPFIETIPQQYQRNFEELRHYYSKL